MVRKTSRTSRVAAVILIVVNLIAMTCCALLFTLSLWMIASPATLSAVIQSAGHSTVKALLPREVLSPPLGVALAAVSGALFCITFMGVYGAVGRSPFLLFMYSILVLLLLMLECALIFYFTTEFLEKGLQERDGHWTHALRVLFQCCEHNATSISQGQSPPWSCCGPAAYSDGCSISTAYTQGCHEAISHWIYKYQTVIYSSLAALHIILSSCSLLRRARGVPSLSHS
ncbi:hypothetical protein JYU34_018207 [Plutella xylostella]|uniref:Tetraspanin n=1 Tax=Plutella xylostella TaxID=51655 RepID=A0ABQ7Q029_PLUXY|nr:hypothetical protein JYU34_018207 [Plutella xylostella]